MRTYLTGIAALALVAACTMAGPPPVPSDDPTPMDPNPSTPAATAPAATSAATASHSQPTPGRLPTPTNEAALAATPTSTPAMTPTPTPTERLTSSPTPSPSPPPTPSPSPTDAAAYPNRVPRVTIRTTDVEYDLRPWTWCYLPGCQDGFPPDELPSVGEATQVEVEFPIGEWTFAAEFREVGKRCPRTQHVVLPKTGPNTWLIEPAGLAGTYSVDVFGYNDGDDDAPNGDVVVTFEWTTPFDGHLADPIAMGGVYSLIGDEVVSYGADFRLIDLAAAPESLSVEMTVTASDGNSFSFEFEPRLSCFEDVYFDAPPNVGERATDLGPAPFSYDVVMVLDGHRYEGHADWPSDVVEGFDSGTVFEMTPPLPALESTN